MTSRTPDQEILETAAAAIKRVLRYNEAVKSVNSDAEAEVASVTYDSRYTNIAALHKAPGKRGYKPAPFAA